MIFIDIVGALLFAAGGLLGYWVRGVIDHWRS